MELLDKAFELWFQYAFDNNLWVLTQEDTIVYEGGFAAIELMKDEVILVTEHDAYGFTVLTNDKTFQQEKTLRVLLDEAF